VSNAQITYLRVGDNSVNAELIPDVTTPSHDGEVKAAFKAAPTEGSASYQLVGGVTAHQGYDG
jgi:hypothetical protein